VGSQFCSACGAALEPGAQFCAACGAVVALPPSVAPSPSPAAPPPSAVPADSVERPLSVLLGVQTARQFWVQHIPDASRHSYQVANPSGVVLFHIGSPASPQHRARWMQARGGRPSGLQLGPVHFGPPPHHAGNPTRREEWGLEDFGGNLRAELLLVDHGAVATSTLSSVAGQPLLTVQVTRSFSKVDAKAAGPDGQLLLEARGSLHHPQFALHDAAGGLVATVRQEVAAGHSSYRIELVGAADPVDVTVFAVLIDTFKGAK
jgi:hypothetical protein